MSGWLIFCDSEVLQQHFPGVEVNIFDTRDRIGGSRCRIIILKLGLWEIHASIGTTDFLSTKRKNGCIMSAKYAAENYKELGFPKYFVDGEASKLYLEALKPLSEAFEANFEEAFMEYKDMSFESTSLTNWVRVPRNPTMLKLCVVRATTCMDYWNWFSLMRFSISMQLTWSMHGGMSKLPEMSAKNCVQKPLKMERFC